MCKTSQPPPIKHAQSRAVMPNCGKDESASKRVVAPPYNGPDLASLLRKILSKPDTPPVSPSSFRANTMKTELRLRAWPYYVMKPEALPKLDKLASEGASIFDMIDVMDVDFEGMRALRWESEWFDQLFNRLEDRAAYVRTPMGNDI